MRTIRAAVTESNGAPFVVQELELGELQPDEVLVEVAASGICHTDLICRDQWLPVPLPAVLGHEGAGTVKEVGVVGDAGGAGRPRRDDVQLLRALPDLPARPEHVLPRLLRVATSGRRGRTGRTALSRRGEAGALAFLRAVQLRDVCRGHVAERRQAAGRCRASRSRRRSAAAFRPERVRVLNVMRPPAGSSLVVIGHRRRRALRRAGRRDRRLRDASSAST